MAEPGTQESSAGMDVSSSLRWQSLAKRVEDEREMQSFFQQHLTGILQPINEHVDELQAQMRRLSRDHCLTDSRTLDHNERLDGQDKKLAGLSAELAIVKAALDEARRGISQTHVLHHDLANEVRGVKAEGIGAMEKELQNLTARINDAEQVLEESSVHIQQLQNGMDEAQRHRSRMDSDLSDLRHTAEGLNERQLSLIQEAQQAKQFSEGRDKALAKLTASFQQHKKEAEQSHARSDERYRTLEAMIDDTNNVVRVQGGRLKKTEADIKQLFDILTALKQETDRNGKGLDHLTTRATALEERAGIAARALAAQADQLSHDEALLNSSIAHLGRHDKELQNLQHAQQDQAGQLQALQGSTGELGIRQERLERRLGVAESDLKSLTAAQSATVSEFEAQGLQLKAQSEHLTQTNQDLETLSSNLQSLGLEFKDANDSLARIDESLDLAHRYLQGFGKGMQETHRRVSAGQDGLLAPKAPLSKTLPILPSPRAGRARTQPLMR